MSTVQQKVASLAAARGGSSSGASPLPPINWLPAEAVLSPDHSPPTVRLNWQGPFAWAETKANVTGVVPESSGVYVFFEYNAATRSPLVWYVGESISLGNNRFRDYYAKGRASNALFERVLKSREPFLYFSFAEAFHRESELINRFRPFHNEDLLWYRPTSETWHHSVKWYAVPLVPKFLPAIHKPVSEACAARIQQDVPADEDGFYVILPFGPTQVPTRHFRGRGRSIIEVSTLLRGRALYVGRAQQTSGSVNGLRARLMRHHNGESHIRGHLEEFYRNHARPIDLERDPFLVVLYIRETCAEKAIAEALKPQANVHHVSGS